MKLSTTSAALLACCLLAPSIAQGQQGAGTTAAKLMADEHFSRGQKLFAEGQYTRAAEEFERAYEIHPHQAVLANIAMCYDKAGKLAQAVVTYRRYLANPVDAGKNTKMQSRLRELEAMVGELDIECPEPECRVTVDGTDRGEAPVSVVVLPGSHRIEAYDAEGERIATANGRVGRGEVASVELQSGDMADDSHVEDNLGPTTTDTTDDDGVSLGAPFWVATGLTVAAGAATIAFGSLTVDAHDRYEAADRMDNEARDEGERYRLLTNVMIGVTAAAATAAVAFAIYDVVSADDETEVALVPGPGTGIGIAGEF
jgi:tetratricopeptide (TPR) repeat protein